MTLWNSGCYCCFSLTVMWLIQCPPLPLMSNLRLFPFNSESFHNYTLCLCNLLKNCFILIETEVPSSPLKVCRSVWSALCVMKLHVSTCVSLCLLPWWLQVAVQDGRDEGAADHRGEAPAARAARSGLGHGQSTWSIYVCVLKGPLPNSWCIYTKIFALISCQGS